MTVQLGVEVSAVETPEEAARNQAIIITITSGREPVLKGEWLAAGAHINAAGSNFLSKAEIDVETVRRSSVIAVDSVEQAKSEAGDLLPSIERGLINWESLTELSRIVVGQEKGRTSDDDITLFKSHGIALEDISTALRVYHLAKERGLGETLDLWCNEG
jgi:alanine dehydrogenase